MVSTKTKFCEIKHKPNDRSVSLIKKALVKAENRNYHLFKITPKRYVVQLVYSNKEYDKKTGLEGHKTPRVGYVLKNKITIISPTIKKYLKADRELHEKRLEEEKDMLDISLERNTF